MSGPLRSLNPVWESVFHPNIEEEEEDAPFDLPLKTFCTGSKYLGQWKKTGMDGVGTFTFPHGVEYHGHLQDGKFHGEGVLMYPQGQHIDGIWRKGHLAEYKYVFADDLSYGSPWKYCKYPDRRFQISHQRGLQGTPTEFLTNALKPRPIPPGMYDTVDGFYDSSLKCVVSAWNHKKVLRILTSSEEKWTFDYCRKAWDENVGYKPEIYEKWTTGHPLDISLSENSDSTISVSGVSDISTPTQDQTTPIQIQREMTTLIQNQNEMTTPMETLKEITTPIENQKEMTTPIQNEKEMTTPIENQKEMTTPIETQKEMTIPIENQKEMTTPIENQKEMTTPIENQKEVSTPIENQKEMTTPIENQKEMTTPIENQKEVTTPIENQKEMTTPIENRKEMTTPIENQKEITTPIENQKEITTPIQNQNSESEMI